MKKKTRKTKEKLLSMLLTVSMLFSMQGIPVMAETVMPETNDAQVTVDTIGAAPSNPVHHCTKHDDGTDYTDWSYVYFGSYPQTEVMGDNLTSAITGASYDANGDAWVNGIKYRRISKSDTNYDYYFGSSTYRYFKWERIKWRVLNNNGSTLFVVADQGIDCKDYHDPAGSITWENCTLRNWLNNDFYSTAFSSGEQDAIVQQSVVNEDNPVYGTEGGNNTMDKVYLLSIGEVRNPEYGFCENSYTWSASRRMQTSDYAHARGVEKATGSGYEGNCWWWLRSPGLRTFDAARVKPNGNVSRNGYDVDDYDAAVVPALHINLSSDLWSSVDDETSGEGGNGGTGSEIGDSTDTGNAQISCIEKKELSAGKEEFLFLRIHADREEEIDAVVNTAAIVSSDESVLKVGKGSCEKGIAPTSAGVTDATWLLKLRGVKAGKATVEINLSNGAKASCEVTVTTAEGRQPIPVNSEDPSEVAKAVAFSLEDYVSDIQGEDVTIQGPTLDIFGKQFSLFEMNASTKIGMENLKAEVSYDVEKKLVKVLVGVDTSGKAGIDGTTDNRMCNASWSEEYNQFKNLYKQMTGLEAKKSNRNGTYWNQFEKLKGKMNRFQCRLLVEANMWASGYMEWSYESGELKFSEGGFVEQATLGVEIKKNIPQIPLCYWFVGVTADEKGNFIFRRENTQIVADFSLTPSLTGKIGLGMGKSEGKFQTYLEGSMDAILAATIANQDPKLTVTLNGNLYAKGYAIGHQLLDETYPFPEWQIYPNMDSQALDAVGIGDAEEAYQDALPLSRDYLTKEVEVDALGLDDTHFYEQNNVFPYCEPHLFALSNGQMLLLYIGDDGTKSLNNRTSLMYTIYDGTGWSETESIAEDGTYVDGISAYQDGDSVYITYRKADAVFSEDASLADMASSLDLYEITFDGISFDQPVRINEAGNGMLESGQVLYAEDGELTVVWMENSENDIFLNSGTNRVYRSTLKNGVWSQKVLIAETEKVVSEINIGSLNGKLTCVYALQNGEKIELYAYDNGNTRQILTEYEQPGEFSLKGERLYFLNKDTLYNYDGSRVQEEGSISGISNFRILEEDGKLVLIANVPGSSGSELYVAEQTDGVWSDFRQYTSQGGWIRDYSAAVIDGEVKAAINCLAPDPEEKGNYKDASLIVTGEEEVYDLKADYIYYEDTAVSPGNPLPLEIGMTNQGKNTITQVTVVLKDGNGKKLGDKQVSCNLKPGDSSVTDLKYVLPNTLSQRGLSVELFIPKEEIDTTNNMVATEIHYIDLAVKNAKCTLTTDNKLLVTGTLANQGLEDISNIHAGIYYSTLTGEKLDEITADILKTGESIGFTSILPGDMVFSDTTEQLNALMICAESDAEERNYVNNEARIVYNASGQLNEGNTSDDQSGENTDNGGTSQQPDDNDTNNGNGSQKPDDSNANNRNSSQEPDDSGKNDSGITQNPDSGNAGNIKNENSVIKVNRITVAPISKKIAAGRKVALNAKVYPKNANNKEIRWYTGNKNRATVNSQGIVTTKKAGKGKVVYIIGVAADGSNTKVAVRLELMKNAVTKVQIKNPPKSLNTGKSITLKTTVKTNGKDANKTLKWTTSNSKYATVNSKGKVTAKKAGKGKTVTITAVSTDGTNKKAKVKIKIK